MYDVYMKGSYQFTETTDLKNFKVIDSEVKMNFHPVMDHYPITRHELLRITDEWGKTDRTGRIAQQSRIAGFPCRPGNPLFPSDPKVLHLFYYGRTAGLGRLVFHRILLHGLKTWQDEGVMLDLKSEQVPWADGNAWAPCIEEKKLDGKYKYFFYYSGNPKNGGGKQIGVATSDSPPALSPIWDALSLLLHPSVAGNRLMWMCLQTLFRANPYLYWGNGYMAGAELNDDMVSIKENTVTVMTPAGGTFAGLCFPRSSLCLYRNGLYYFMWSVDDTVRPITMWHTVHQVAARSYRSCQTTRCADSESGKGNLRSGTQRCIADSRYR